VKKLLLLAAVGVTALLAACSDTATSPLGPRRAAPSPLSTADFLCARGYVVAYDENGNPTCVPDPNAPTDGPTGQTLSTQGIQKTP